MNVDESAWSLLTDRLEARVLANGVSGRDLWRSLVRCALSGDHVDAKSAFVVGLG